MTPAQLEPLLLLEQSGELTDTQRRTLDAALAADPAAAACVTNSADWPGPFPRRPTPPRRRGANRRALAQTQTNVRAPLFLPAWKPALAAAAALALLLGVQLFRPGSPSADTDLARSETTATAENTPADDWTDPLADEFAELENLLTALSGEDPFGFAEL
jgi:anti-sigma factor RsiW